MLAIASLATGFVVAAVTPSHALGGLPVDLNKATDALSTLDISQDSLAPHDDKDTRED
ncbi:hypothetical protein GCM10010259_45480 [Streptomyces daghestanicus]|nr:hypothetical protein GCM10010238_45530 [Streptomyces niveoruber]GGT13073.1 hypothetical protein GCM10010240_52980 [Streptomyces griseoviridis]GGU49087.1 hypothetical protein GCM10010259_45480 [Streptomyces daghestanicus]GHI29329.1 hypothetical protein Sdagh_10590 [Streptomyces daghestanicus]